MFRTEFLKSTKCFKFRDLGVCNRVTVVTQKRGQRVKEAGIYRGGRVGLTKESALPKSNSGYWCFPGRARSSNVMTIMSFPWVHRGGTWRHACIGGDSLGPRAVA